jgi:hypothetical protein
MAQTYQKLPSDEWGSYSWLKREVSGFLGMGYNPDTLSPEDSARIDSLIDSGVMTFYYPPPMPVGDKGETMPHRWSFLSPVTELVLSNGEATYALPSDFAGIVEEGFTVGQ